MGLGPFGWWECQLEESDEVECAATCGLSGVKSLTVQEYPVGSNNPFIEPSCEVNCTCNDGTEDITIDPPEDQTW